MVPAKNILLQFAVKTMMLNKGMKIQVLMKTRYKNGHYNTQGINLESRTPQIQLCYMILRKPAHTSGGKKKQTQKKKPHQTKMCVYQGKGNRVELKYNSTIIKKQRF